MSSPVQGVTGYCTPSDGFRHAVGLDGDCAVRETFFSPGAGEGNDLLAVYSTATALSGFVTDDDGRQHVIAADRNGYLSEMHWKPGDIRWYELPIGPFSGIVSISAFYSPDDYYRHVIVATDDGNITEIYYHPSIGVHVSDNARELAVATNAGGYFRDSSGAWHDLTPLLPKPATGIITAVAIDAQAVYFSSRGRGVFRVRGHRRA